MKISLTAGPSRTFGRTASALGAAGAALALALGFAALAPAAHAASASFAGYEVVMQDSTDRLLGLGPNGGIPTNFFLAPDSSPAIADLGNGVVETTFVAGDHTLWRGSPVTNSFSAGFEVGRTLHVWPGSSPAVAGDGRGGFKIAFHGSDGALWTINSANRIIDSGMVMWAGSSPSLVWLPGAQRYEFACVGNDGMLHAATSETSSVRVANGQVVMPGTSPAIATDGGTGFKIAFHALDGHLVTATQDLSTVQDTGAGMSTGSNPALVYLPGAHGYELAFAGPDNFLYRAFPDTNWFTFDGGLSVAPGTSPSIDTDGDTGFQIAFHAQGDHLWLATANGAVDNGTVLAPGSSPSIAALSVVPTAPPTFRSSAPTRQP